MGFSIERNGMIDMNRVCHQLITDMIAHGFKLIWPADPDTGAALPAMITSVDTTFWVVESTLTVDPLSDIMPWRIAVQTRGTDPDADFYVATPLQIQVVDGSLAITDTYPTSNSSNTDRSLSGKLGDRDIVQGTAKKINFVQAGSGTSFGGTPSNQPGWKTNLTGMVKKYIGSDPDTSWPTGTSYPFAYRLSISDHGVAFCVWYESQDVWGEMFSWFVVQRPVHPKTGVVLLNGKCPLFCMYSLQGGSPPKINSTILTEEEHKYINWFVVCERDVTTTSIQRCAVKHTKYATALINPCDQISFTEDNEFIVNFPNNLSTDRYAYVHELDMIGYTSAKVVAPWSMAKIHMYGETGPDGDFKRTYQALMANRPLNEGMRIMMLVSGGGVDYAWPPIADNIGTIPTTAAPTTSAAPTTAP